MKSFAILTVVLLGFGVIQSDGTARSPKGSAAEDRVTRAGQRSLKSSKSSSSSSSWSSYSSSSSTMSSDIQCYTPNIFGPYNTVNLAIRENHRVDTFDVLIHRTGVDDMFRDYQDGPFTVFAPTDTAFNFLDSSITDRLLEDEFSYHLTDLLLFHVVDGEVLCSAAIEEDEEIEMANGMETVVEINRRGRYFIQPYPQFDDQASWIVRVDNDRNNGVVHEISRVLQPMWVFQTLYDTLEANGYDDLAELVTLAGLEDTLRDTATTLTIFAPTDEAFDDLDDDTVECLLANPDKLADLLLYHTIDTVVDSSSLTGTNTYTTLQGNTLTTQMNSGQLEVNGDADVDEPDLLAINGIVHGIDEVIAYAGFTCP